MTIQAGDSGHVSKHNTIDTTLAALASADTAEATARAAADTAEATARASAITAAIAAEVTRTTGAYLPISPTWQPSTAYKAGQLVTQGGVLYAANADFTSGASFNATNWTAISGSTAAALTPTAVKTANYTAAAGDLVPVDTTSGPVTVTLPTTPADKTQVAVKHVIQGGTNVVTVACGGAAVLNKAGGATSFTMPLLAQAALLQYKSSGAIWYVVTDDLPLTQLDSRFALQSRGVFGTDQNSGRTGAVLSINTDATTPTTSGRAVELAAYLGAMNIVQTQDWSASDVIADTISITHRSLGDAIAINNIGGRRPGYAGAAGNMTGVLSIVPAMRDPSGVGGWTGTITNDHTGASCAWLIQQTPYANNALRIEHYGSIPAIYALNQDPAHTGGGGMVMQVDDYGVDSSIRINKLIAFSGSDDVNASPQLQKGVLYLDDEAGGAAQPMLRVAKAGVPTFSVQSDGTLLFATSGQAFWDTKLGRSASGKLSVYGALEIEYAPHTAATPTNGIKKQAAANNILQFYTAGAIVMDMRNGNQIGFFGSVSSKRATTADATDLASVITLANALKADLQAYGLKT